MTPNERAFLARARTATLATIRPDGTPRLVPICFVLLDGEPPALWTPIDEKPKRTTDPRSLARVRDIEARPDVGILVDRWDEDWAGLGWVRAGGRAALVEPGTPGHDRAVAALRAKYPPYATHALERRPMIRIDLGGVRSWGDLSDRRTAPAPSAEDSASSSSPGDSPRH